MGPSALQSPLTGDGAIVGTPGYMSPEQARGAAVDARSDQFSFCVAYPHLPLLWAVALGYEIAAVVAARWPQYGMPVANLAYTALAIGACYVWARAVRRPTARPR